MATPIQLTLTLDASGALTVTNQLGQAIQKIPPPSSSIKQTFDTIESSEQKAHTTGELFTRLVGVELPRAFDSAIAKSQIFGPLMTAGFNGAIIATAGTAVLAFGEKIADAAQTLGGFGASMRQMRDDTIAASNAALVSPKTLAAATQNLAILNQQKSVQEQQAAIVGDMPPELRASLAVLALFSDKAKEINDSQDRFVKTSGQINQLLENSTALAEKRNALLDQENAKANESGKIGFALLAQQEQDFKNSKEYAVIQLQLASTNKQTQLDAQQEIADHDKEFAGQRLALERGVTDQTIALRHQVDEANLHGITLIHQQESDAIDDINRKQQQTLITDAAEQQQRAFIHKRASDEVVEFQRQENNETIALIDEARDASLKGDDLIYAHQQERVDKERDLYLRGEIDFEAYQTRVQAIDKLTQEQITANHLQTARELGNLQEQERDAESAVALSYVAEWQKANAQALVDRDKQLRIIDQQERELLVQYATNSDMIQQITETEQARRAAVWAQTDEKIRNQHQQLVEQLGSDISSLFDDMASGNLGQRILKNAEALFAQILAQWILSLGLMKTAASSLFGNLVFGPGTTGSNVFGGSSLLGSLFGSSSTTVPASAFGLASSTGLASGSGFSATSAGVTLPGLVSGGGLAGAISGTGATSGVFSASNALTTQSLSQISGGGSVDAAVAAGGFKSQPQSLLGSLFSTKGLAAIAPLALLLAGGAGGKIGQAGGLLGGLLMSGTLSPLLSASFGTLGLAGTGALFGGAVGGLLGFGIGENKGGLLGSLAGAGSGALTGFMVGGPIGAIAGGIIGLLGGIFGGLFGSSKRKQQANSYVDSTIVPDISQITNSFDSFQLDSNSALQQLDQLESDAQKQLATLKSQGVDIYNQRVVPAIDDAEKHVRSIETERERRAAIVFGPAQFHEGGFVDVMKANIRRQPNEMLAVLKHGEYVVNPRATAQNLGALQAINSGGNAAGSGGIHLHFHALDSSTFQQWAKKGGGKEIVKALLRERQEGNF